MTFAYLTPKSGNLNIILRWASQATMALLFGIVLEEKKLCLTANEICLYVMT